MIKKEKNFLLENNISKSYFKKKLYVKDRTKLNRTIKNIYNNLDSEKNTLHILSKKFTVDFKESNLKKFKKYKSVVLIGMGGSILGAHSIYSFLKQKIKKKFIFL